ncbi:hypothetical protein DVH05_000263 [Phytophthora capsici]|nr:hypothetical protein DVH05_025275 [Phytophthora capsici]KAG1712520.1 hypothetical protein DVH05_000263 [Phytophthora capsici]
MSFLPTDEENIATLKELFAFIDCSGDTDEGGSSPVSSEDSEQPLDSDSLTDVGVQPDTNEQNPPKRRRVRVGWSSSTGLQRRKRAELEFLRQHTKDLEVYLQQLKVSPRSAFASIKTKDPVHWKKVAKAEVTKLLRSEEVNRALKAILNNQLQMHEGLRSVMEESISAYLPMP